ncbi:MAG: hypothetical protein HYV94_22155 [Candidatus Rokubacteria bacterium]|nr:hypothetical protein [Candidatus Rokubacteria bacterium]
MSLGLTAEKLRAVGVETVGVVATAVDRARRYFRYRPPRYPVGADPELATHRAFGVPRPAMSEEILQVVVPRMDELARDSGLAAPPGGGWDALDRQDGIDRNDYASDIERHQVQLTAQFLLDRDGVIRWANIECGRDGLEGLDRLPTDEEFLAAARAL